MTSKSEPRWKGLALLLLLATIFLGAGLGKRDLWNPNEPTYGRVVMEMVESGDWMVPRLNGEPFFEKPILYYWLAAGISAALGEVSHVSVRAPVMLATVGSVLLLFLLIEPYDGRRRAWIGCAIFTTLYSVWFSARNAQMDSFVLLSTLGVLLALSRRLDHGMSGAKAWALMGAAAGFGFAAKGPVAIVVPGLIAVTYLLASRRSWKPLFAGLPLGLLFFVLLASPWYLALTLSGQSEGLYEFFIRQNFTRFVNAWDHRQPWWYYLEYFWLTFAPWSWFVPVAAGARLLPRAAPEEDPRSMRGELLAWVWILVPLIFFSLSESKREPYMLPIAPAIAWIVARLVDNLIEGRVSRWQARGSVVVSAALAGTLLFLGLGVLMPGVVDSRVAESARILGGSFILPLSILVVLVISIPRSHRFGPVSVWVSFSLLYLFIALFAHGAVNSLKSHRGVAAAISRRLPAGATLYSYFGNYRVVRGGYPYYLQRSVPDLPDEETLRRTWEAEELPCVLYEEEQYRSLVEGLPSARVVFAGEVGSSMVNLVCADEKAQALVLGARGAQESG